MKIPYVNLLTKEQLQFLDAFTASILSQNFKFAGGTALVSFYIPYRYSDDLDFFSAHEFDPIITTSFIKTLQKVLGFSSYEYSVSFNRNLYFLRFPNNYELKLEFTYYPFESVQPENEVDGLKIESYYDIAVNKLFTIYQKPRYRDFTDLYMLIHKYSLDFDQIKQDSQIKFDTFLDPIQLGANLLQVKELQDKPILIEKLPKEWENYFISIAKHLGTKILN